MSTSATDEIRNHVSESYAKAVSEPSGAGCCSGAEQKGELVKLAGYDDDELRALPPEAVANSFGCGNPLAFSDVAEGDVVVDLGAGAGIDLLIAAKKVGPFGRAIGVDMTGEMIAKARANIAAAGLSNAEVRKGIIEDLPVKSASVDWVISNCVINLSPEKDKVFAEIARVLKPGGRMLVSDIVVESLPDWVRQDKVLYASCVSGAISEAEYLDGLRAAGLADTEVRGRLVYDESQICGLIESDLAGAGAGPGASSLPGGADGVASSIAGKVWSALFYACKPVRQPEAK